METYKILSHSHNPTSPARPCNPEILQFDTFLTSVSKTGEPFPLIFREMLGGYKAGA